MRDTVIFDIDGTLANSSHRSHLSGLQYMQETKNDAIILHNCNKLRQYASDGTYIILLTSRHNSMAYRHITVKWLYDNNLHYDMLLMMDNLNGKITKLNTLKNRYNIIALYDDDDAIIAHCESVGLNGIKC